MTEHDLELIIRRVYDHMRIQPHEHSPEMAFKLLADELAEAGKQKQPEKSVKESIADWCDRNL